MASQLTEILNGPTIDRGRLIHLGAVIESATGEHLARIAEAADFEIELDNTLLYRAAQTAETLRAENSFNAELSCDLYARDIDLRKPVPAQVAQQLREWARQLSEMATKVETVPPQRLLLEAKAHNIVNLASGETFEAGAFYSLAHDELLQRFTDTGHAHKIVTSPLSEWPAHESEFNTIVFGAIERSPGGDIQLT